LDENCNVSRDVMMGDTNRGKRKGTPIIGDNVFIGPGTKIFGAVRIGNNVAIGSNSVVCHDVPDDAVVVGAPARVISYDGSTGYIMWTDYDRVLGHLLPQNKKRVSKKRDFHPTHPVAHHP
jgi:serine O-acetyltransferase